MAGSCPTYGEIIDLYEAFGERPDAAHLLCSEMSKLYPCIRTKRPGRLFDSMKRIVAPTRPSLKGTAKVTGSPLASYRKRIWEPRIRTADPSTGILILKFSGFDISRLANDTSLGTMMQQSSWGLYFPAAKLALK